MTPRRLYRILVAGLAVLLLVAPLSLAEAESIGSWTSTTNYSALNGVSCTAVSSTVYCVGGVGGAGSSHNEVDYATLSSSGIGAWTSTAAYPTAIDSASCVNATGGIYCVGGEDSGTVVNDVYFASASSSGVGAWTSEASYPNSLAAVSCVAYSGYIYCVGGFDNNGDETSSTYYASVSSGLSSWTETTQYPLAVDSTSCNAYQGYIYCVAGETEVGTDQNSPVTDVYYAALSSSGIGPWQGALSYPTALAAPACAQDSGYVYCVGGFDSNLYSSTDTYYAPLSSSGVGSWANATPYPIPIDTSTCVAYDGNVYCVSGTSDTQSGQSIVGSSYYSSVSGAQTTSTTPEFPVAAAIPAILALSLVLVAGMSRATRKKTGKT
jgi:N-acetylneuraminic acid mutarotase